MLFQARNLWKRGTLLYDMGEEAAKSLKASSEQGLDLTFNAKRLINWLRTDRFFKQALDSEEQQGIMGLTGGAIIPAKELGHNISLALQMHTGRQLLVDLALNTVSRYTPAVANLLGAFTSTMLNGKRQNDNATPQAPGLADTMMHNLSVPAGKEFQQ